MNETDLKNVRLLALIPGHKLFGSERGNIEALKSLKQQGARVTVLVTARVPSGGAVGEECRRLGFDTVEFHYGSHFSKKWMKNSKSYRNRQIIRIWSHSLQLLKIVDETNSTHIMLGTPNIFIFFAIGLSIRRIPLIYRMGDSPPKDSRFQMFFWHWLARRSNKIVAISEFIKNQAHNSNFLTRNKTSVILNKCIEREGPPAEKSIEHLREQKAFLQLIFVGQTTPQKGTPELVQALIHLDNKNVSCWILGSSKYEKPLKELINDAQSATKIEFLGFIKDPSAHLAAADWHIAPSVYDEPLGNVVQEAKAAGTPSIVSPNGGLPELIQNHKDGLILEQATSEQIRTTILFLLDHPEDWESFGIHAKESISTLIPPEQFDKNWRSIFEH